jgi:hypothetical protein
MVDNRANKQWTKNNAKHGRTKLRGGIGIMMGELSRCGSMRGSVSQKKNGFYEQNNKMRRHEKE